MIAGRINGINLCFSSKSDSSLHPRCREAAWSACGLRPHFSGFS
jgi:hypothetical protein